MFTKYYLIFKNNGNDGNNNRMKLFLNLYLYN